MPFARLSPCFSTLCPCAACPRHALPGRSFSIPRLLCAHPCPCIAFPSRGYTKPKLFVALPICAVASHISALPKLWIASLCLSIAGQRLAKQCLSFCLAEQKLRTGELCCAIALLCRTVLCRCATDLSSAPAYRCPAIQCPCSSWLSCADALGSNASAAHLLPGHHVVQLRLELEDGLLKSVGRFRCLRKLTAQFAPLAA